VRMTLSAMPKTQEVKRVQVVKESSAGAAPVAGRRPVLRMAPSHMANGAPRPAAQNPVNRTVVNGGPKIGRNDPCPCGSGKKYKKCCGRNDGGAEGEE